MKAIAAERYGSPEVLRLKNISKPVPGAREALVKVHMATVTAGDCEIRRFDIPALFWLFLRVTLALKNRHRIFGQEYSGTIEHYGDEYPPYPTGTPVFGPTDISLGAHAEFMTVPIKYAVPFHTEKISFQEAATIPTGGLNALHFVRMARLTTGSKLLINGAGGSIGTYAIQLARLKGAEVTAVDSVNKLETLKGIGANHVIDYRKEDFTSRGQTYDAIIDVVGNCPINRCLQCLNPGGRLILGNPGMVDIVRGWWTSPAQGKKVISRFAAYTHEDLIYLRDLMEQRKIRAVIDRTFDLENLASAHQFVEKGNKTGHVIIRVKNPAE